MWRVDRIAVKKEEGAGFEEDRDEYEAENIFWVPKKAGWTFIKDNAKDSKIGQYIDDAMILIKRLMNLSQLGLNVLGKTSVIFKVPILLCYGSEGLVLICHRLPGRDILSLILRAVILRIAENLQREKDTHCFVCHFDFLHSFLYEP